MRRIALLWLILTPIWIAFSFYASVSKIAFVPPALAVVAVVLHWLHKHFVVAVAGEPEPRAKPVPANPWPSQTRPMRPDVRPIARPSRNLFRPALIAVVVGACFGGAAMAFVHTHRPVANTGATARVAKPDGAGGMRTEAMKSQFLAAEPKPVQTQAVKSQSFAAAAKIQDNAAQDNAAQDNAIQNNATPPSPHDADARRVEAPPEAPISPAAHGSSGQTSSVQTSSNVPRCNVSLCETYYQSFRASDCTYQPRSGPRQYCGR
jgi:hypothetical protein